MLLDESLSPWENAIALYLHSSTDSLKIFYLVIQGTLFDFRNGILKAKKDVQILSHFLNLFLKFVL